MKYTVQITKPVADIVRANVEIEAESAAQAIAIAQAMDKSELDFEFWQCADFPPEYFGYDYEVEEPLPPPPLVMYFVAAEDEHDCTYNLDLFVQATDEDEARKLWRAYYDRATDAAIKKVFRAPAIHGPARAINWSEI